MKIVHGLGEKSSVLVSVSDTQVSLSRSCVDAHDSSTSRCNLLNGVSQLSTGMPTCIAGGADELRRRETVCATPSGICTKVFLMTIGCSVSSLASPACCKNMDMIVYVSVKGCQKRGRKGNLENES